jgi:hypothetical protein
MKSQGTRRNEQANLYRNRVCIGSPFFLMLLFYTFATPHASREKKKRSKFQRTPNALPPLDITPLFTLTMQKLKSQEKGGLQLIVSVRLIVLSAARATGSSVKLGGDGVRDVGQLLLLLLEVFGGG